jgi:hypothetical protein
MHVIADTEALVAAGVIDFRQARDIEAHSRQTMTALAINTVLFMGILSATAGLVFWLRDPVPVAIFGALALMLGFAILARGAAMLRMFGNSAALIGAGTLTGGAAVELVQSHPAIAGQIMLAWGAGMFLAAAAVLAGKRLDAPFVTGSICALGLATHLGGLAFLVVQNDISGPILSLLNLYAALLLLATGWFLDVRLVTALAIVPLAQVLDTSTLYFHAVYAFYSPEPTLSILQMSALTLAGLWVARHCGERTARHGRVVAVLAFIAANLCALVGSLWGDVVGETVWGPARPDYGNIRDWNAHRAALDAFREHALIIPEGAFAIAWAVVLVAMALWSAHRNNRGLFNTSLVFAVLHAYTQLFESFGDRPLAYVIAGLVLIPVAWGMWRFDAILRERAAEEPGGTGESAESGMALPLPVHRPVVAGLDGRSRRL